MHPVTLHRIASRSSILCAVLVAVAGPLLASRFTMGAGSTDDIPRDIAVEGPVVATVHATGFQVYTCAADSTGVLAWKLKGPDATFENEAGLKGKHYTGPTWEAADGSVVVGKKAAEHASPDASAVPWLLLTVANHKGNGVFSDVSFIQRIHTSGGKAPAVGTAKAGDEVRVPYTADYVFYGKDSKRVAQ